MNTPRRLIPVTRLTENSAPGRYVAVTKTRTTYFVDVDPDCQIRVVRYPVDAGSHGDEVVRGVEGTDFNSIARTGSLYWWKGSPERDHRPDGRYFGTVRRTSAVRFLARVWPPGETPSADAALLRAVATLDEDCSDEVLSWAMRNAWTSGLDVSAVPPDVLPDPTEPADAAWARIIGPCYTSKTCAAALGMNDSELSLASDELRLLRLRTRDGVPLYPAFQVQGRRIVPGLQAILLALSGGTEDPWTWAEWLNAPFPTRDGPGAKRTWIAELAAGREELVVRAARHTAASWSS